MSSYQTFAQFYDRLTDNVDYKVRSDYISNFFSQYGKNAKSILDLACGTGSLSKLLSEKGYNVTGVDLSEEMLTVASDKCGPSVRFIKADMTDFSFSEQFDCCVCTLDSINHLDTIEKVGKCFDCVAQCIKIDGVFVFDVNTIYKHKYVLADNTFVFDEEDFFLSWDNESEEDNNVRILLDFFVYNGINYDRFSEEFTERAYTADELKGLLSSFEIIGIYDELTFDSPKKDSERIYFVCKRK